MNTLLMLCAVTLCGLIKAAEFSRIYQQANYRTTNSPTTCEYSSLAARVITRRKETKPR